MIKAKPLSEQECQEANLIPKGIYKFKVLNTLEKKSPKVGDFFSLKINIFACHRIYLVFDALFFTENMMWKTRHFYQSINKLEKYETGKYHCIDCDLSEGHLEIDHRKRKDTGDIESYVKDYISPEKPTNADEPSPFVDDKIPNFD